MVIFKNEELDYEISLDDLLDSAKETAADNEYDYMMRNPAYLLEGQVNDTLSDLESFLDDDAFPDELGIENVKNNQGLYDALWNATVEGNEEGFDDARSDLEKIISSKISNTTERNKAVNDFKDWNLDSDKLYSILGLEQSDQYDYSEDLANARASEEPQD